MPRVAPQDHELYEGEVRNIAANMAGLMDEGETLSSIVSIQDDSGLLSITSEQINSSSVEVNGVDVAAGLVVQFRVDRNGAANGCYLVDIECLSSAAQEVTGSVRLLLK